MIPPPALPKPPESALAPPTISLSKKPVHHTWHGTNVPPRIPTKNLKAIRPLGLKTHPARTVGMAPQSNRPAKTTRGPKRSQSIPLTNRIKRLVTLVFTLLTLTSPKKKKKKKKKEKGNPYVAKIPMIFELATSFSDICKSFLMVTVN